jgi:hypothetical protein
MLLIMDMIVAMIADMVVDTLLIPAIFYALLTGMLLIMDMIVDTIVAMVVDTLLLQEKGEFLRETCHSVRNCSSDSRPQLKIGSGMLKT